MIKGKEVSDTAQQRERQKKRGRKEMFRRISLPPRLVNSISLPFSRGNVLDPMGTDRKFAVSPECGVISYSVYICDPPPPRARKGGAHPSNWRPILCTWNRLGETRRNGRKETVTFRRSSQGNDREEVAGLPVDPDI